MTEDVQMGKCIHENSWHVVYTGTVKSIEEISGIEAVEIESHIDASSVDANHEYIVMKLVDGGEATFRASHTNIYIL